MAAGHFRFDALPAMAEVFGPASYREILAASAPERVVNEDALDGWPLYLVVLRGQFVSRFAPTSLDRQPALVAHG